jgi:limonene-1,2-epoxide hydrolase
MNNNNIDVAAVEQANADLTRAFNQAWSDRDCDTLLTYLHDEVAYMVYEGGPVHVGTAAVAGAVRPFMAKFERIEFEILRLQTIGSCVIHERTENYYASGGSLDTRFHVVGLLVIQNNKINMWRDYSFPGAEQLVGDLVTQ